MSHKLMRKAFIFIVSTASILGQMFPALASEVLLPEDEIMITVDRFFEAINASDTNTMQEVLLPTAVFSSIMVQADGTTNVSNNLVSSFFDSINDGPKIVERYWDPILLVNGPIAVFFAPYDMHVGGQYSHCGIDNFDLIKVEDQWRIQSIRATIKTFDCEKPMENEAK